MTREELGASLNLQIELIGTDRPNRPGTAINPQYITIHNTSNTDAGADASANSSFVRLTGYYIWPPGSGNRRWVSWHYTVDDVKAIKQLPVNEKAFHAGGTANSSSIGIEICMHQGIDQEAANDRAARLAAVLLYDFDLSIDRVRTHGSWTGKNCPKLLLNDGEEGQRWEAFKNRISEYLDGIEDLALPQGLQPQSNGANGPSGNLAPECWSHGEMEKASGSGSLDIQSVAPAVEGGESISQEDFTGTLEELSPSPGEFQPSGLVDSATSGSELRPQNQPANVRAKIDTSHSPMGGWRIERVIRNGEHYFFLNRNDDNGHTLDPLLIGKKRRWPHYNVPTTGLQRTTSMEPRLRFDPDDWNADFAYWPEILYPTAYAESTANFLVVNAWDNAAITLTFFQLAAHAGEDLLPCLKRVVSNLPDESRRWFPELSLSNGELFYDYNGHRESLEGYYEPQDGAATSWWYRGKLMQFFNPNRLAVDAEELHATARWVEWTRTSRNFRREQVGAAIDNARHSLRLLDVGLRTDASDQYPNGVDGLRGDYLGAALAQPHYHNRVAESVWALQQTGRVLEAFASLNYSGHGRERNVVAAVRRRETQLRALRYDSSAGHPVRV